MQNDILKIILGWGMPILLSGMFGFMIKIIKDNKAMKNSMLSLIRSQIVGKCEKYLQQGYIHEYARYCLEDLFKQYEILGGNHGIKALVDRTYALPLETEVTRNGQVKGMGKSSRNKSS